MERAREPETLSSRSLASLISWLARRLRGRTVREFNLCGPRARVREHSPSPSLSLALPLPPSVSLSLSLSRALYRHILARVCCFGMRERVHVRARDAAWAARTRYGIPKRGMRDAKSGTKPRNMGM